MRSRKTPFFLLCMGCFACAAGPSRAEPRPTQSAQTKSGSKSPNQDQSAKRKVEFDPVTMGELLDEDGIHLGFTDFKAADGSRLTVLYENFASSTKAKDYFEKQLARAANVIERKDKLNAEGKAIGERAEILKRMNDNKAIPAVLWTDGVRFHEIYSSSRESILKLEKVYMY